ncbi:MAG TPA: pyruvate kinase [Acidobacteriota bacterium]|nr:pyruvate kinase [Acidobacteriota bacterium]
MPGERITQIVATIGPASRDHAPALWDAGATTFRLNASHMRLENIAHQAAEIRRSLPDCPIVIDLQGAKMRLGDFQQRPVRAGDHVRFSVSDEGEAIPLPHREIFASVAPGETLSCDDGRLRFRVTRSSTAILEASALIDGTLRPRKGVNVVEHPILLADLSDFDQACVRETAGFGSVGFAFSFMNDGREAAWLRRRAPACTVIGKVERREATENIHAIGSHVDIIWICRGDLGAQLGEAAMAQWISRYEPRTERCAVLMAGQVLEHLTAHSVPTRSEVCHLFDLVERGYAGFVLSDETAIGEDPIGAVRTLRALLAGFRDSAMNYPGQHSRNQS